uniref:Uncharacterized protein n=1 Tax=Marseillevirus LCMAC201 TaxID=2506605 RepID=A0A481YWM1_9VIRU|nr:MAG: hypothetical protein LCMAC201_05010 [Marseillevirus LCMAC201]
MRQKLSKKERLAEKKEAIRRRQLEKSEQTTEMPTDSQIKALDQQIKDTQKQIKTAMGLLNEYIEVHTIGGDVEYRCTASGCHFAGSNSTELNRMLGGKQRKIDGLENQLENLRDKREPGRQARLKQEALQRERASRNMLFSFGLGTKPPPKKVPQDVVIVERKSVGLLLGNDGKGGPANVRCYHRRGDKCLQCDCHKIENEFTLSEESQALLKQNKLVVDDEVLDLQRSDIKMSTGEIINRWAGIGESISQFMTT